MRCTSLLVPLVFVGCALPTPPTTSTSSASLDWVEPTLDGCDRTPPSDALAFCDASTAAIVDGVSYDNVQAAITSANPGDVVWVCPGTWTAALELDQQDRTLAALDPTPGATTLEGDGKHRILSVYSSWLSVDGLALRGGRALGPTKQLTTSYGGGIYAFDADLEVRCAQLEDNEATLAGGAIFAHASRLTLQETIVSDNMVPEGASAIEFLPADHWPFNPPKGRAPVVNPDYELAIDQVTVEGTPGHGLMFVGDSTEAAASVTASTFRDNALGAEFYNGRVSIESSMFAENTSGLRLTSSQDASLVDVDIVDNAPWGGMQLVFGQYDTGTVLIEGGTVSGNEDPRFGGAIAVSRPAQDPGVPDGLLRLDGVTITGNLSPVDAAAVQLIRYPDLEDGWVDLEIQNCDFGLDATDNSPIDVLWGDTVIDDVLLTDVIP